jgi:hypothetical protein
MLIFADVRFGGPLQSGDSCVSIASVPTTVFPETEVKLNELIPLLKAPLPAGVTRYSRPQFEVQVPRYLLISPFAPVSATVDIAAVGFFAGLLSVAQPAANTIHAVNDAITDVLLKVIINSRTIDKRLHAVLSAGKWKTEPGHDVPAMRFRY